MAEVHDQHDRRRDQDAEGAACTNDAGREVLAIARRDHGREREQSHQRHHRPDDAAGGGEHRTGDESGHGHGAWQVPGRELQRIEEPVDDVRALHHVSHEQEERHRDKGVVLHHRVGVLVEQIEDLVVERVCDSLDGTRLIVGVVAEPHSHGDQREGDRKAEQHQHDEQHQHQDRDFGIGHGGSSFGMAGGPVEDRNYEVQPREASCEFSTKASPVSRTSSRRSSHTPLRIARQQRRISAPPCRMSSAPATGMRVLKK